MLPILIVVLLSVFSFSSGLPSKFVVDKRIHCANNGVGYSNGQTSFCKCGPNTTGKQCQIIIATTPCTTRYVSNPCANNPCQSRGVCQVVNGNFYCQCQGGYYGSNCQYFQAQTTPCTTTTTPCTTTTTTTPCITSSAAYNPCQINPCQNNGQCLNNGGYAACNCMSGFTGTYCQTQITTPKPTTKTTTKTTTTPATTTTIATTTTVATTTTPVASTTAAPATTTIITTTTAVASTTTAASG